MACAGLLIVGGCSSAQEPVPANGSVTPAAGPPAAAEADGAVTIADSWVKSTLGAEDTTMTAAFGVLTNHTDKDLTVVSATNSASGRTELHEMAMADGAMVMRPVAGGITVPAGGSTTLEPGGLHVMIMDVQTPLPPGEQVTVSLTFDNGSTMSFQTLTKEFAGANENYQGGETGGMSMGTDAATAGTEHSAGVSTPGTATSHG